MGQLVLLDPVFFYDFCVHALEKVSVLDDVSILKEWASYQSQMDHLHFRLVRPAQCYEILADMELYSLGNDHQAYLLMFVQRCVEIDTVLEEFQPPTPIECSPENPSSADDKLCQEVTKRALCLLASWYRRKSTAQTVSAFASKSDFDHLVLRHNEDTEFLLRSQSGPPISSNS